MLRCLDRCYPPLCYCMLFKHFIISDHVITNACFLKKRVSWQVYLKRPTNTRRHTVCLTDTKCKCKVGMASFHGQIGCIDPLIESRYIPTPRCAMIFRRHYLLRANDSSISFQRPVLSGSSSRSLRSQVFKAVFSSEDGSLFSNLTNSNV